MTIKEAVSIIKTSLENTAIATVKSLKSHVFKVDIGKKEFAVANWPKKQVVEGKVAVVDLEKLEKQLVKIAEWQKNLEKSLRDLSNKDTVKVANFPKIPEFPQFPTSTKLAGEVKVSSGSFSSLLKAIEGLSELVAKLPTYYPEVKIPPFPKVEIPPFPKIPEPLSEVSIKNLEKLISKDPQRYVPVRLSDGKRFYQAIEELTVSASRAQAFSDSKGVRQQALVDEDRHVQVDVLTMPQAVEIQQEYMGKKASGDYDYFGFKDNGGTGWKIMRKNNTNDSAWAYAYGTSDWTTAWADPTVLVYGDPPNE